MSKRERWALAVLCAVMAIVVMHLMVWASTWPHERGVPWIIAGFLDVGALGLAAVALAPSEGWAP